MECLEQTNQTLTLLKECNSRNTVQCGPAVQFRIQTDDETYYANDVVFVDGCVNWNTGGDHRACGKFTVEVLPSQMR